MQPKPNISPESQIAAQREYRRVQNEIASIVMDDLSEEQIAAVWAGAEKELLALDDYLKRHHPDEWAVAKKSYLDTANP